MCNDPAADAQLIDAATHGDPEAIEQLLYRYQPSVIRFAHRFCVTPEDVEDAVQETLWIAAQQIGTLRVASAFGSWLFKVVRHQCFRLLRGSEQARMIRILAPMDIANDDTERQATLRQDLTQALRTLQPIYLQVWIMRDLEDMRAAEVASHLGITVRAVKSRLHRARATLRLALEPWKE